MSKVGRPLGSKKQGAPKKIIHQLDKVLRYNEDLDLFQNIDRWKSLSTHINISLYTKGLDKYDSVIECTLFDKNMVNLETLVSNIHPFAVDQYHLLYISNLKILEAISTGKTSIKKILQHIVDAKNIIENTFIAYDIVFVDIPSGKIQSYKIHASTEIHEMLRTKEFQSKLKEKYIEFWNELEMIARSLLFIEEKFTARPKTIYKLKNPKSKEALVDVLNDLESPIRDKEKDYSSILEILSPKKQNREYISQIFGLNKSALKK